MNLVIKKIEINNFKGITDLKLNFTDNKNILEGENGIGKTTVLDAITWCLFGKNFADEKQFNIKPIIDGEEKVDLLTSVELLINDTTIERIWDNKSSVIKVNDVKFGIKEFNDYLRDKFLITDEEFKALSNVDYIPSLNWKDLRSLIMGLVGEITNEEVYEKGNFDLIKEKIESVGVEKTSDDIKDTKLTLSNDIKRLQGNIDQKNSDIQELVIDDEEQKILETRKEEIKKQIDKFNELKDKKSKQDLEKQKYEKIESDLSNNLKSQDSLLKDNEEYQKTYDSSNIDASLIKENKIKSINNDIENTKKDIERLDLEKGALIADREDLRKKYEEEVNRDIKVENNMCSTCGQPLPENKIEEALNKLKEESRLLANGYATKAKEKLNRINEIDLLIQNYKDKIKKQEEEIESVKTTEINISEESDIQIKMRENIERNNEKINKLKSEYKELENEKKELAINISKHENIEIVDTNSLQDELEEITKKIGVSIALEKFKEQLKELEAEYKSLIEKKELLNEKEQQLISFNNTRAEMLRERVKHNFKLADFITQETTKDGKLVETFKIAIDGVEYKSLNTGHKILVALDLIDNIQRMKEKRLPILIDGLGELTRLPELNTQIIGCRARYQANKKLEVVNQ